ncbi:MAG: hypothetical protein K2X43_23535 [Hyphomonadaceae bacterium]|jgi:hypothetical protein|nr:hypothetical protein [Hyphomonadaceae bacterium]
MTPRGTPWLGATQVGLAQAKGTDTTEDETPAGTPADPPLPCRPGMHAMDAPRNLPALTAIPTPSVPAHELTLIERVERAMVVLALCIELDGDVHLPMYEKFEAELEELKQKESTRERARARLAAYKDAGARRQIR